MEISPEWKCKTDARWLSQLKSLKVEDYEVGLAEFWNECEPEFAHLETKKWLISEDRLRSEYERNVVWLLDWPGLTVVDYGIGAGFFGRYLLEFKSVNKYIGIDISERSLDAAKQNLMMFPESDIELMLSSDVDFGTLAADVFVSLACIQHFPSQSYLDSFLSNLDGSGIPRLILQIRHSETTCFLPSNPQLACRTNVRYLLNSLSNYSLGYCSSIAWNGYQVVGFHRSDSAISFREGALNGVDVVDRDEEVKVLKSLRLGTKLFRYVVGRVMGHP